MDQSNPPLTLAQVVAELKDLRTYAFHLEPYNETYTKIKLYGFGDRPEGVNATPTWNVQAVGGSVDETFQSALRLAIEARAGVSLRAAQRAGQGNYDLVESEPKAKGLTRAKTPKAKLNSADLAKLMGL